MNNELLVGVSNRHVHLSKEHLSILFGEGYELEVHRTLRQKGQFACKERVTLVGKEERSARVVGPVRQETQVEIITEDKEPLGIDAPIRLSGNLEGTPGITLKGPKGEVILEHGVIIAAKHVHMCTDELEEFSLHETDHVDLKTGSGKVFENVPVRKGEHHMSEFHLDKDEAKRLGLEQGATITISKRHV